MYLSFHKYNSHCFWTSYLWAAQDNTHKTVKKKKNYPRLHSTPNLTPAVLNVKRKASLVTTPSVKWVDYFQYNPGPLWPQVGWEVKGVKTLSSQFLPFSVVYAYNYVPIKWKSLSIGHRFDFLKPDVCCDGSSFEISIGKQRYLSVNKGNHLLPPLCSFWRLWVNEGHTWPAWHICPGQNLCQFSQFLYGKWHSAAGTGSPISSTYCWGSSEDVLGSVRWCPQLLTAI